MADQIELRGLRVMAHCGILPEEVERKQPFEIDADIELDLREAADNDDVTATIHYGEVVAMMQAMADTERFGLLERFASEMASRVLEFDRALVTRITIRKLRPPVPQDLASSGVTVERRKA